jgi:urease accessory protein
MSIERAWIESAARWRKTSDQQDHFRSAMRNNMRFTPKTSLAVTAVALAALPTAAFAHIGDHSHMSFAEGLAHPFSGLDHLLAMIAVGLWASQIGGRALWLLPLTFPAVMAAGAVLGFQGAALPWVEIGIAASVLVLGALIALKARPSLALSMPLIVAFAVLHGYSHGVELPANVSALTYAGGFIAATLMLHLIGIALGLVANRLPVRLVAQAAGGAIAAFGAVLLVLPH